MIQGIFLPLVAVLVAVAAISGTIPGTVINGIVITGAMITAHVCALRVGKWRIPTFALIFTTMPIALALGIANATQITINTADGLAFDQGHVTQAGLWHLLRFSAGITALALIVDTLAHRFLPR